MSFHLRVVSKRIKALLYDVHGTSVIECLCPLGLLPELFRSDPVDPKTLVRLP
jgi:hypothetical protein